MIFHTALLGKKYYIYQPVHIYRMRFTEEHL